MSRYFDELKRRNVFRVAAAYAVVGWLTIEVIDTIAPRMAMPEWVPGFVIILVLIGFPIALLFSWAFEMTPEGLKKTAEVDPDQSITSTTGQKINYVIIVALTVVVLFQQFAPSLRKISPFSDDTTDAAPIAIAVLPFADLSPAGDQEYLGDGVAEEILNVLADIDGLKVTSRTSAFAFKDQNRPIPEIAGILGVSHIVEGSIRKQNERVRITAQLIEVHDDSHLWSETYDSDLSDIFRLQDEIASQISAALSPSLKLTLPTVVRETPDWDVAAYELYLRARQLVVARTDYQEAIELLDAALKMEPEFADAWAEKATALALHAFGLGRNVETIADAYKTYDQAWIAARRATVIDPQHPLGLAVQGLIRMNQYRWIEARIFLERAISVKNSSDNAFLWLGIMQSLTGDIDGAMETIDAGLQLSPTAPNLHRWRAGILAHQGRWQEIWETRNAPSALSMEDTLVTQQIAALHLGEINVDDFAAWLEKNYSAAPEQRAFMIDIARKHLAENAAEPESADVDAFLHLDTDDNVTEIWPALANAYFERTWRKIPGVPNRNNLQNLWRGEVSAFRNSSEFYELVRALNLPAYWELYGWPDVCRPSGNSDFVCDQ